MIELEFRKLLREAMNEFYKDIPDPEELEYEYTFFREIPEQHAAK